MPNSNEEFLPNTVGAQQAQNTASAEAATRSTAARISAAVAENSAAPLWTAPSCSICRRAEVHKGLRKANEINAAKPAPSLPSPEELHQELVARRRASNMQSFSRKSFVKQP